MKGFLDTVGAKKAVVVTPRGRTMTVIKSARIFPGGHPPPLQDPERLRHRERRKVYR